MNLFYKIIDWFNEKKVIIGLLGISILQIDNTFDENAFWYKLCVMIFGTLAAGGFVHKTVKFRAKAKAKKAAKKATK